MFYFAFVHILYVSICLFFLTSHATFVNAPSLWLQYDLRAWHCFKQIKPQNLDPASPLPLKCTQVKLLTQIMTSCSQLGLAQPSYHQLQYTKRGAWVNLCHIPPMGTGIYLASPFLA